MSLEEQLTQVENGIGQILREREYLLDAAYEALEYFEDAQDVVDGSYGEPRPNRAMVLAQTMRDAIRKAGGKP